MERQEREWDCSVVIPAFNAERTIAATVRSVLAQRRPCLEVLVMDDGSTDATAEVAGAMDDARVQVIRQANAGPSAARNRGIAAARGRYVSFLDSDDLWLPTYLEAVADRLEAAAAPGFAYTDAWVFEDHTGRIRRETAMVAPDPPPPDRLAFVHALLARNFIFTSTTVPAAVLEAVGGFDESLAMSEEYDLWLRILLAGREAVWVPGPHALYRQRADQLTSQALTMVSCTARVLARLDTAALPTPQLRARLQASRREADREVAVVAGDAGWASRRRGVRHRIGRARRRVHLTREWMSDPPQAASRALAELGAL